MINKFAFRLSRQVLLANLFSSTVSSTNSSDLNRSFLFILVDVNEVDLMTISITESHSNRLVSHTMTRISPDENQYKISFVPYATRQHTISIFYENKLHSIYHLEVCNLNKIRVSSIEDGIVGIPSVFSVDTHGAGEGHLEVVISDGQRTLPAELKSSQTRKFDISFIPEITGEHSIAIAFNGLPIEGSPFKIQIEEPSLSVSEDGDHEFLLGGQLEGTKVGEVAWLICETSVTEIYEDLDLYVTGQLRDVHWFVLLENSSLSVRSRWDDHQTYANPRFSWSMANGIRTNQTGNLSNSNRCRSIDDYSRFGRDFTH